MKKYIVLFTAVLATLIGCSDKKESLTPVEEISVSTDTLKFNPEGGTLDVKVTSSADWRMAGISEWVTPSATSGASGATISFTAASNDKDYDRKAEFKVFVGATVRKIVAISLSEPEFQLSSDSEMTFSADGGTGYIRLQTNVDELEYSLSGNGSMWIDLGAESEAFGYKARIIDVKKNNLYVNRESVLTVKGGVKSLPVKIIQRQRDTVGTSVSSLSYDLESRDVEFKIRTNIDADYELADWMTLVSVTDGAVGDDGLVEKTFKIHLNESVASRSYGIKFSLGSRLMLEIIIRQKNPNPVITNISDAVLRDRLAEMGWIYSDGDGTECEVLESGLVGKKITITTTGYSPLDVKSIDGLGGFPMLEELAVVNANVRTVDVSDCPRLAKVSMSQTQNVEKVVTGSSPVTDVEIITAAYGSSAVPSICFSGNNIKTIRMNSNSSMIGSWEKLTSVDVTGCPALGDLHAKRAYVDYYGNERCVLKTIYVTAAQKAAIDAGTLTVEKSDLTNIQVK